MKDLIVFFIIMTLIPVFLALVAIPTVWFISWSIDLSMFDVSTWWKEFRALFALAEILIFSVCLRIVIEDSKK